jgi:hypothetical protein
VRRRGRRRGYNTAAERATAEATDGIRVVSRQQCIELLKWGIMMGVDDGCGDDN